MAPVSLLLLGFLFPLLHSPEAQTTADFSSSSSSPDPDLPINSPPQPTKHTAIFRSSLPPRGRSDVPIRAAIQDRLTTTNSVQQWQRSTHPSAPSTSSFISDLSTQNLSSGPVVTQPTSSRARTDTASLALIRASAKADAPEKGSTPPQPIFSSSITTASADEQLETAANPELETVKQTNDDDLQELGSGSIPSVTHGKDDLTLFLATVDEMAQFLPQAQTAISKVADIESPEDSPLTTTNKISLTPTELSSTLSPVVTQATPQSVGLTGENSNLTFFLKKDKVALKSKTKCVFSFTFLGELTANTPSAAKQGSAAVTLAPPPAATTGSQTAGQPVTAQSSSHSKTTPQQVTTASNTTTQESVRRSSKVRNQPNNTAQPGRNPASTTLQWSQKGKRGGLCSD